MAVQQNKKSPSKRGMHRSHNALSVPGIAVEPTTGETHLRHHISPNGFYRGRQVIKSKTEAGSMARARGVRATVAVFHPPMTPWPGATSRSLGPLAFARPGDPARFMVRAVPLRDGGGAVAGLA